MDIVIPYRNSASNGLELRYTLRGIEKYFPEVENVFIIGDCPGFVQNVIHIPHADSQDRQYKQRNIYQKLMTACQDKRVSDVFAWVSDDHFLLKQFEPGYYYRATLKESISSFTHHQNYRMTLLRTYSKLGGGLDYVHGPMAFAKDKFTRAMSCVDWNQPWGYAIKSLYCGLNGIYSTRQPDLKIKQPMVGNQILRLIKDQHFFSAGDAGLNEDMKAVLRHLFPNKSKYELQDHQSLPGHRRQYLAYPETGERP